MALSKTLQMDLPALAEMLRSKGRGKDTILAHINPREAALLKRRGGSGDINPDTGLPQFDDGFDFGSMDIGFGPGVSTPPVQSADIQGATFTPQENAMFGYSEPSAAPQAPQAPVPSYDPMQAGQEGFTYSGAPGQQISPTQTAYTPDGRGMSGADILAYQQGNYPVTPAGAPGATGGVGGPKQESYGDKALRALTDPNTLARLGLTGALGAYGANVARKAGTQTQAATQEQKAIAQPYTQQGQQLVAQAQQGTLNPASQQAYQAAQAQLSQQQANRGGVGAQQSANQLAAIYQTLLDNQYKYGLQIMQVGDNITMGAIKSGLQLDTQLQATTNNFYSQLASIAAGGSGQIPVAPSLQTQRTA
jgi:hypothetical protein